MSQSHPLTKSIDLSVDVANALALNQPVIALESTIISHGLPWPNNFEIGCELESAAKDMGVVPATIAVIEGRIKVGLNTEELRSLAQTGTRCRKLSSFDLGWAIAHKETASTTVAATMWCAEACKIKVFATGGIGGVHRGFVENFDCSHDIDFLARSQMIVVSAGAKAILDLEATVEMLESRGVLVVGWKTKEFPAFYYSNSGIPLNYSVSKVEDIVSVFEAGTLASMLVVNPVKDSEALPKELIEPQITRAIELAKQQGIRGKELTPFLLRALKDITEGKSVQTNLALVRGNVLLGCQIAKALCRSALR